jgi:hypothetical protein
MSKKQKITVYFFIVVHKEHNEIISSEDIKNLEFKKKAHVTNGYKISEIFSKEVEI